MLAATLDMDSILLRPLRAGERSAVLEVFAGLSERSRRLRFLGSKPRLLESDLEQLVDVGRCGREAVAAVDQDSGRTVGIARFVRDEGAPEAEIAFEVIDEWHGLGSRQAARHGASLRSRATQGILRFRAVIAHGNRPAFALVRGLGEELARSYEDGNVEARRSPAVATMPGCGSSPARIAGRRIAAPKGLATRPTGDRVREAAFNLIGPVDDARVLDLFAGSGALGLEALSRGAASVTFVESDRAACRTIADNLAKLKLTGARVTCGDAVWAVRRGVAHLRPDPRRPALRGLERARAEARASTCRACSRPTGCSSSRPARRTEPQLPLPIRTSRRYGSARLTLFEHPA